MNAQILTAVALARKPVVDQIFGANRAPIEAVIAADFADLVTEVAAFVVRASELPCEVRSEADQLQVGRYIAEARTVAKRVDEIRTVEGKPLLDAKRTIDQFFKEMAASVEEAVKPLQRAADAYVQRIEAERRAEQQREAQRLREQAEAERRKADEAKRADTAARAEAKADLLEQKAEDAEAAARASAAELTRVRGGGVTASARTARAWEFIDKDALYASLGPLSPFFAEAAVESAINSMVRTQKGRTALPGVRVFEKAVAQFRG